MKKITIAKERLSREKMSGNLPSNEILEKYKFKNGYEITDLGNGYVDIKENIVRGLRSKVGILEEAWTINLECGHIITEKELRENAHCPICNTRFSVNDDSKIVLNSIERLKERLNK